MTEHKREINFSHAELSSASCQEILKQVQDDRVGRIPDQVGDDMRDKVSGMTGRG